MPATTERKGLEFDGEFLRKLEYLNVVARKIFAGSLRADRQSPRRGTSAEFADHRSYSAGDDFRHVDWHLFGRLEELFIKRFREEENLHLTVLLDSSLSMESGQINKFNYGMQVTAALAYIGMANLDSVNVLPFGDRLRDGIWKIKGRGKVFTLFNYLKSLEPATTTDLQKSFREFIQRERRRGVVIVVSDFYDFEGIQPALKFLKYPKNDIFVIHVVDETEEKPDVRGDLRLVDSETGGFREINVTDALLARYKKAFAELSERVETYCIKNEMGYVRARTTIPFDELVLGILRRGGLIR
ncbi:MAG: DUF58 domain-containing protein [Planctomycetes bacterium]|nr:DUF58 domain-containing protein [Planctomycetota bacterium]